jgi:hypothetical protein
VAQGVGPEFVKKQKSTTHTHTQTKLLKKHAYWQTQTQDERMEKRYSEQTESGNKQK